MLTVTIDQSEGISGADIPEQAVKKGVQAPPPRLSTAVVKTNSVEVSFSAIHTV